MEKVTQADRLRAAMKLKKMSQSELSRLTGIPKSSISSYLSGKYEPKQNNIYKLAKALEVTEAYLMGLDNQEKTPKFFLASQVPGALPVPDLNFLKSIPILGGSACGTPIEANREYEYINIDELSKATFALYAVGKSMTGCGIMDGSLVLFAETPVVENGDIAAVTIENETTIKKFYKYGDTVILKPCNPEYEDQVYSGEELEEMHVFGKAVGCLTGY